MSEFTLIEPDWQKLILEEIGDRRMTRDVVAHTYQILTGKPDTDWRTINTAIIERWSKSALEYIKRKAHGRCIS